MAPKEKQLRDGGFGFFGAITASLSHEINNVLATINELSGLLADFLAAADHGAALDPERFKRPVERIGAQIKRGQTYVRNLNQFAHTVDHAVADTDLNQAAEAIVTLCRRFGALKRVELELEVPEATPHISGCPFDIEHVLYRCIEIALGASQQGDTVHVGIETTNAGARARVRSESPPQDATDLARRLAFLAVLTAKLNIGLAGDIEAGNPVALEVAFPRELRAPRATPDEGVTDG